jgi:hypothetical protein
MHVPAYEKAGSLNVHRYTAVTPLLDLERVLGGGGGGESENNSGGFLGRDGDGGGDATGVMTATAHGAGRCSDRGGGGVATAAAMRERAEMLRVMLRECVVWGGCLQRLECALALALTELETAAAAAGISLSATVGSADASSTYAAVGVAPATRRGCTSRIQVTRSA